jgi:hypothetical protein
MDRGFFIWLYYMRTDAKEKSHLARCQMAFFRSVIGGI